MTFIIRKKFPDKLITRFVRAISRSYYSIVRLQCKERFSGQFYDYFSKDFGIEEQTDSIYGTKRLLPTCPVNRGSILLHKVTKIRFVIRLNISSIFKSDLCEKKIQGVPSKGANLIGRLRQKSLKRETQIKGQIRFTG